MHSVDTGNTLIHIPLANPKNPFLEEVSGGTCKLGNPKSAEPHCARGKYWSQGSLPGSVSAVFTRPSPVRIIDNEKYR